MSVNLSLAKSHCRVTSSSEDTIITAYLNAAIAFVENYTRKKLTASTAVSQTFNRFPPDMNGASTGFLLSWGPSPAAVVVSYTDTAGGAQTLTTAGGTARLSGNMVYPALDAEWPEAAENSVVSIAYTVGYATTPADLDAAVLLLVGEYYDNRSAGMASPATTAAVHSLCEPFRTPSLR